MPSSTQHEISSDARAKCVLNEEACTLFCLALPALCPYLCRPGRLHSPGRPGPGQFRSRCLAQHMPCGLFTPCYGACWLPLSMTTWPGSPVLAPVIRALLPAADMMVCVARPLTAPRPLTRPLSRLRFMVIFIYKASQIDRALFLQLCPGDAVPTPGKPYDRWPE